MKKNGKGKKPPTKEQLIANDPLWEKIFNYRVLGNNNLAEELKEKILLKYKDI